MFYFSDTADVGVHNEPSRKGMQLTLFLWDLTWKTSFLNVNYSTWNWEFTKKKTLKLGGKVSYSFLCLVSLIRCRELTSLTSWLVIGHWLRYQESISSYTWNFQCIISNHALPKSARFEQCLLGIGACCEDL